MLDFSQILAPVGVWTWESLSRRHYPKVDDAGGVALASVVDLIGGVTVEPTIPSVGVDAGNPVVLHYRPAGSALDRIPAASYRVTEVIAEYERATGAEDDFLEIVLGRIESRYGLAGFAGRIPGRLRDVPAKRWTPIRRPTASSRIAPRPGSRS